jgi:hypothetical protein
MQKPTVVVTMDHEDHRALQAFARSKGLSPAMTARMIIVERLQGKSPEDQRGTYERELAETWRG